MFDKINMTTKEKILKASLKEFGDLGLAGARVDHIAEIAGINKAMIYYHYDSKENLYREVFKHYVSMIAETLKEKINIEDSLEEILTRIANIYATMFTINKSIRQLVVRELAKEESEIIVMISETIKTSKFPQIVADKLTRGMTSGEIRKVDIRQTIVSFIVMNIGYFILSPAINRVQNISDVDQFVDERKKAVVDLFLNGVLKK